MHALQQVGAWPAERAAVAVTDADTTLGEVGPVAAPMPLASVTKVLTALAVLVAVEEEVLALEDAAGPPGSTVRHLLAHASGLAPDGPDVLAPPGTRRIYSNAGFEALGAAVAARTGLPFATYLREAVIEPLGLSATALERAASCASGASGSAADLAAVGRELLRPTLVSDGLLDEATTTAFPGLAGVLPGFGRQDPNDWGLGFELRDGKRPHWTGPTNSPATFGHFGRSGTFLWVDPVAGIACACVTDREFGPWAARAWPALAGAILQETLPHGRQT